MSLLILYSVENWVTQNSKAELSLLLAECVTIEVIWLFLPTRKIFWIFHELDVFFKLCFIFVCLCLCFSCFYCSLALVLPTYSFYYIKAKIEETITQARCKYCESDFRVYLLSSSIRCSKMTRLTRFWNTQGLHILVAVTTKSTAMILTHSKHARNKKYSTWIEYEQVLQSHWQSPPPFPALLCAHRIIAVLCPLLLLFSGSASWCKPFHMLYSWHCASKALPFLCFFCFSVIVALGKSNIVLHMVYFVWIH